MEKKHACFKHAGALTCLRSVYADYFWCMLYFMLMGITVCVDAGHPDYSFLVKSQAEMEVLALHVNNSKKVADSNLKLIEIQTRVKRYRHNAHHSTPT